VANFIYPSSIIFENFFGTFDPNDPMKARGKTGSVGIDVHKRSWHLTAVSDGMVH
jgi:hypothetical protein